MLPGTPRAGASRNPWGRLDDRFGDRNVAGYLLFKQIRIYHRFAMDLPWIYFIELPTGTHDDNLWEFEV